MRIRTCLLVFLFLAAAARAAASQTILIVGDSLSAAYGMSVEQGWVTLLQQRLELERFPYRVVNASISGDTTASALNRLPQAIAAHQPVIVVLGLGGNDGLRGLPLRLMQENLAAMIETASKHQARVLLLGVQLPPNYGPRYTEAFHAVYQDLAADYGLPLVPSLVDGVGTDSELMQGDGIHPNAAAQPVIFNRVWRELRPLLRGSD